MLAVDERQSLESLSREEKIAGRTLAQLNEKEKEFEELKFQREEERRSLNAKLQEVRHCIRSRPLDSFLVVVRDKEKPASDGTCQRSPGT